jgi:hypothetical protein
MPWEPEHNIRSLSPHHLKAAEGLAARGVHDLNSVPCPDMPPGITSMTPLNADPHRAGPKMDPYAPESSRRPVGEPREILPPHNIGPHDHLHSDPRYLISRGR